MQIGILFSNKNEYGRALSKLALLICLTAAVYAADLALLSVVTGGEFWRQFTSGTKTQTMTIAYAVTLYLSMTASILLFRRKFIKKPLNISLLSGNAPNCVFIGAITGIIFFSSFFIIISPALYNETIGISFREAILHALINLLPCFFLAFSEEAIFRGIILEVLAEHLKKNEAITVVSIFFALVHLFCPGSVIYKLVYFINLFLFSILLCIGTIHFKNIWVASGFHFAVIYLVLIRNYLNVMLLKPEYRNIALGFDNSPMTSLTASGIMVLAICLYKLLWNKSDEK